MLHFFRQFGILSVKEIKILLRRSESLTSTFFFCFLVILIVQFGFPQGMIRSHQLIHPLLWIAVFFGATLQMGGTFEPENRGALFDTLRVVPGISVPLYLSKFFVNLLFVLGIEIALSVIMVVLFHTESLFLYLGRSWPLTLLATIALVSIGTTFSPMAMGKRRREILLAIVGYPILLPILIGVMKGPVYSPDGVFLSLSDFWIQILAAFDVIYLTASLLVFDSLLKA